jgi:DNA-binding FadR family transcriptional regulator
MERTMFARTVFSLPTMPKGRVRSAVEAIGLAIVGGEFAPGATLPREEALAQRFGLARSGLREAIKVLSGKGLVRTMRRYGSRVRERGEWNFLDPDVLAWHLRDPASLPKFLRDIREMRLLIEPVATAMAAQRASATQVAEIITLAEQLPPYPSADSIDIDVGFHVAVLRASGNLLLAGLGPAMGVLVRAYLTAMQRVERGPPPRPNFMDVHRLTARAIEARDPVLARRYAEQMLEVNTLAIERVLHILGDPPDPPGGAAPPGPTADLLEACRDITAFGGADPLR